MCNMFSRLLYVICTIPVAFIYKSPLISNRGTIICDKREFILCEFTFETKCVIIEQSPFYGILCMIL